MRDTKKVNLKTTFLCFLSNLKVLKSHEGIFMEVYWWYSFSGNIFEICKFRNWEFENSSLKRSAFWAEYREGRKEGSKEKEMIDKWKKRDGRLNVSCGNYEAQFPSETRHMVLTNQTTPFILTFKALWSQRRAFSV